MAEATRLARALVDALVLAGVREVVLSPGSRSAPLALAVHAADRAGRLRLHVRVDERGAGFLATGLARGSERPVAVLTTSGTAVANLHPAVLEAWHSHLPLLVVTADRPASLTWTGANQTTHQGGLFAAHVRGWATLSDARDDPRAAAFEVTRLVAAATGVRSRLPGPVHLDVELGDPLVEEVTGPDRSSTAEPARTVTVAPSAPGPPLVLPAGPRTVVVAGDAAPSLGRAVAAQAAAAGVPLLAEPSSNARRGAAAIGSYRLLLGSGLADEVERVVVVGRPTLSRPVSRLLARSDVELVVVSGYADWVDPGRAATAVADAVAFHPAGTAGQRWLDRWRQADVRLRGRVVALLADLGRLSGPQVAATVLGSLGADDVLFVGSSNPVRDLDLAAVAPDPPDVYANRGLSGIDGLVSSAAGVGLARGRPVHALLGDVTLLHDANALVVGPAEPRPDLRVVVVNDDGGSIFATLEQGAPPYADAFERVFATPHHLDLAALADAAGVRYTRAASVEQLRAALGRPLRGLELVEVPVDRAHRRDLDQALAALGRAADVVD